MQILHDTRIPITWINISLTWTGDNHCTLAMHGSWMRRTNMNLSSFFGGTWQGQGPLLFIDILNSCGTKIKKIKLANLQFLYEDTMLFKLHHHKTSLSPKCVGTNTIIGFILERTCLYSIHVYTRQLCVWFTTTHVRSITNRIGVVIALYSVNTCMHHVTQKTIGT